MAEMLTVLNPLSERTLDLVGKGADAIASGIAGKVVGILDNRWPSFGEIGKDLKSILIEKYGAKDVIHWRTGHSKPTDPELLDEIARMVDIGVLGLGN
jgi:hypothetical protein